MLNEDKDELKRLRNLEKTFLNFLELTPDFIYIKDTEHRFLYTSDSFAKLVKYNSWRDLVGKNDFNIFPYEHAKEYFINEKDVIENGKEIFNIKEPYFNDKKELCYVISNKKAIYDENRKITGLFGISRDITNKHFFEKKILEQNTELEIIFEYAQDGIAVLDLESKFLKVNKKYLEMTGFTEKELLQKSCLELTIPKDQEKSKKALQNIIRNGIVNNLEKTCITNDNMKIPVSISASLLPDKKSFLIVTKDMTSLKIIEEQSRLASMGEMIENIAHQWRQPLNLITTCAGGLSLKAQLGTLNSQSLNETMNQIVKQAEYLSSTIDNFRNFVKNENIHEQLSLISVLQSTLSLVEVSLADNFIKIVTELHCGVKILGNKNELIEAFINIVNNSKDVLQTLENDDDKFLFIEIKEIEMNSCEILIKDTGGGIDENLIHKIFDPYFTTKPQSQGTGLGLALSEKIIRQRHGGILKAYNEVFTYKEKEYRGACFSIIFKGKEA